MTRRVSISMQRFLPALLLVLGTLLLTPGTTLARQVESGSTTVVGPNAELTRKELYAVLKQYPGSLPRVIRLDPSLMTNEQFMQPYPNLVAFLNKHPEIRRNVDYFFGEYYGYGNFSNYYRTEAGQMWEAVMAGVAVFVMTITILFALGWIIRTFIDYRRWNRLSKVQNEMHAKLLDRFGSNAELLAYVQSPAGARFLQSSPMPIDAGPRSIAAPFGRILWSVQAGIVLAALGFGLYYVSGRVDEEVMQPIFTLGIVSLFLGIGFVVSAIIAFVLSKQLGLFNPPPPMERRDSFGV
jgi:hypothetical protein